MLTVDIVHKELVASQIVDFLLDAFADECSPHLGF